jgi:hypothetical protein
LQSCEGKSQPVHRAQMNLHSLLAEPLSDFASLSCDC